jgi:hypothetical protein
MYCGTSRASAGPKGFIAERKSLLASPILAAIVVPAPALQPQQ